MTCLVLIDPIYVFYFFYCVFFLSIYVEHHQFTHRLYLVNLYSGYRSSELRKQIPNVTLAVRKNDI